MRQVVRRIFARFRTNASPLAVLEGESAVVVCFLGELYVGAQAQFCVVNVSFPGGDNTPIEAIMNSFNDIRVSLSYAVAGVMAMKPTTWAYVEVQFQNSECAVAS